MDKTREKLAVNQSASPQTVFGGKEIVYFGYDRFSAAKNMAIDEALLGLSDQRNRFYIRFYDVDRPAVILSKFDHPSVIKSREGIDVSRRTTGGRPIFIDKNTLQYSITGPLRTEDAFNPLDTVNMHRCLSVMLIDTINSMIGSEAAKIGRTSSIRIEGKPMAGHAQDIRPNHSFLYHGVIVVDQWDCQSIKAVLNLDALQLEEIGRLPNLSDLLGGPNGKPNKQRLIEGILSRLPKGNTSQIGEEERASVLEAAYRFYQQRYANDSWVYDSKGAIRDVKFCILFEQA